MTIKELYDDMIKGKDVSSLVCKLTIEEQAMLERFAIRDKTLDLLHKNLALHKIGRGYDLYHQSEQNKTDKKIGGFLARPMPTLKPKHAPVVQPVIKETIKSEEIKKRLSKKPLYNVVNKCAIHPLASALKVSDHTLCLDCIMELREALIKEAQK